MDNTGNKIVICQLQNAKSNFPKLAKFMHDKNKKNKPVTFIYTFSGNLCFNS